MLTTFHVHINSQVVNVYAHECYNSKYLICKESNKRLLHFTNLTSLLKFSSKEWTKPEHPISSIN